MPAHLHRKAPFEWLIVSQNGSTREWELTPIFSFFYLKKSQTALSRMWSVHFTGSSWRWVLDWKVSLLCWTISTANLWSTKSKRSTDWKLWNCQKGKRNEESQSKCKIIYSCYRLVLRVRSMIKLLKRPRWKTLLSNNPNISTWNGQNTSQIKRIQKCWSSGQQNN